MACANFGMLLISNKKNLDRLEKLIQVLCFIRNLVYSL